MQKKLTISVSPDIYSGLYLKIGRGKISSFFEKLVRPYVVDPTSDEILKDCQNMLLDEKREAEMIAELMKIFGISNK